MIEETEEGDEECRAQMRSQNERVHTAGAINTAKRSVSPARPMKLHCACVKYLNANCMR